MNRKQRRDFFKAKPKNKPKQNIASMNATKAQEVVDNLPIPSIVAGVNNLLSQLEGRGVPILDWDNQERALYRLQMRRGKIYFLAAEPPETEGEKTD